MPWGGTFRKLCFLSKSYVSEALESFVSDSKKRSILFSESFLKLNKKEFVKYSNEINQTLNFYRKRVETHMQKCIIEFNKGFRVTFDEEIRGVAPGQSAVFYKDNLCLGGGVIEARNNDL